METTHEFITVYEAAERLRTSHTTVRGWLERGILRKYKFGGLVRISADELDRYISDQAQDQPTPPRRRRSRRATESFLSNTRCTGRKTPKRSANRSKSTGAGPATAGPASGPVDSIPQVGEVSP